MSGRSSAFSGPWKWSAGKEATVAYSRAGIRIRLHSSNLSVRSAPGHDLYHVAVLEDMFFPNGHAALHVHGLDEVLAEVGVQAEREIERSGLGRHQEAIGEHAALAVRELAHASRVDGLVAEQREHRGVERCLDAGAAESAEHVGADEVQCFLLGIGERACWLEIGVAGEVADELLALGLAERELRFCGAGGDQELDRKSTRLNSSHTSISYAAFL